MNIYVLQELKCMCMSYKLCDILMSHELYPMVYVVFINYVVKSNYVV